MLVSAANLAHWLVNCRQRGRICSITRQVLAAPLPGAGSRSDDGRICANDTSFLSLLFSPPVVCFYFVSPALFLSSFFSLHYFDRNIFWRVFSIYISFLSPLFLIIYSVTRSQQNSTVVFKTAKISGGLGYRILFRKNTVFLLLLHFFDDWLSELFG